MNNTVQRIAHTFVNSDAEKLLCFGVVVALLFSCTLFLAAKIEKVLLIENGVGLFQNYGLFAALIGDAILFYLSKKYYKTLSDFFEQIDCDSCDRGLCKTAHDIMSLTTRHRYIFFLFVIVGVLFVLSNITLHATGHTETHWRSDVFDSLHHPFSFFANKLFLFYSWGFVIPHSLYSFFITSWLYYNSSHSLIANREINYDLLNPDTAGGFSHIAFAKVFFNLGVAIVYLQIALYTLTFGGANFEHLFGYFVATSILIFGNFIVFNKTDNAIESKRLEALNRIKELAYNGSNIQFELYKYYTETFSKNQLRKKLSFALLSIKSVAILIPPVLKFILKAV